MHFRKCYIIFWCALTIFLSFATPQSFSQSKAYYLSTQKEVPLLAAGATGTISSLLLRRNQVPLDSTQIIDLKTDRLLGIDLPATENYSRKARIASDVFLNVSYLFPLTPLLLSEARAEYGAISLMFLETLLLNETFTGLSKVLVSRPRPFTHNGDVDFMDRTAEDNNLSFFSGHTSYTAAISFFSAQILSQYIDNPTTRNLIWAGAIAWPAATGYFRYKAGKHYVTDVLTGYVVGAALGYFIPRLHERDENTEEGNVSTLQLYPQGPQMFKLVWVF
ncbi:phosphatase PAP2 family protein [Porifericola rhodea]|uniref:phosphatase PAP2 family protein n=1 Tax=Porifericola rhodea TaxID=930972 RepID=UPI0026665F9B|nr:phosphatase PAP2 family protein [Porifericola rhodea]WKN31783.1 phosphatase PAP2 family protein [Porifericola rhodea]